MSLVAVFALNTVVTLLGFFLIYPVQKNIYTIFKSQDNLFSARKDAISLHLFGFITNSRQLHVRISPVLQWCSKAIKISFWCRATMPIAPFVPRNSICPAMPIFSARRAFFCLIVFIELLFTRLISASADKTLAFHFFSDFNIRTIW